MNIGIPVPNSAIGTADKNGNIILSREWYRFFGLLIDAVGGDTNGPTAEIFANTPPPFEAALGAVLIALANAAIDASSQATQATALVTDLQQRIATLEAQTGSPVATSFGNDLQDLQIMTPGTMPDSSELIRTVISGLYTPTLTNTTNLDASTAYRCQWLQVNKTIVVSGKVDVDPTAPGFVLLGISLPIPSNISGAEECCGTAFAPQIAGQGAAIIGDAANDRAAMEWTAIDTTNQAMAFIFAYRVR